MFHSISRKTFIIHAQIISNRIYLDTHPFSRRQHRRFPVSSVLFVPRYAPRYARKSRSRIALALFLTLTKLQNNAEKYDKIINYKIQKVTRDVTIHRFDRYRSER